MASYGSISRYHKAPEAYRIAQEPPAVRFLLQNFRPDDRVPVLMLKDGFAPIRKIELADDLAQSAWQSRLHQHNRNGYGVFLGLNPVRTDARSATRDDIAEVRHLFCDLDNSPYLGLKIFAQGQWPSNVPPPNRVVSTSPDHKHFWWDVSGVSLDEARPIMRALAHELGADSQAVNLTQTPRWPGFVNPKHHSLTTYYTATEAPYRRIAFAGLRWEHKHEHQHRMEHTICT